MDEIYINSIKCYFTDSEWDMMTDAEQYFEHEKYCKYKENIRLGIKCDPPDYIKKDEQRKKEEINKQKERDREARLKRLQSQLVIDATFKPIEMEENDSSDSSQCSPMIYGFSERKRTRMLRKSNKKKATITFQRNSAISGEEMQRMVRKMQQELDLEINVNETDDEGVPSEKPAMSLVIHREMETGRPLRALRPVNYSEEREPDDDELLWCEDCQKEYFPQCPSHPPMTKIADKVIPADINDETRAERTAPENYVKIAKSRIPNAGRGAFSTGFIPKGYRFGPYEGNYIRNSGTAGYCWRIHGNNRRQTKFVDAKDPGLSNWMRFVNCARHSSEQNMVAFQYLGEIYYRSSADIPANTELLVWYGNEFAKEMDINYKEFYQEIKKPLSYVEEGSARCIYCEVYFTSNEFYLKHLKFCKLKKEYDNKNYDETKIKNIEVKESVNNKKRKKMNKKKNGIVKLSNGTTGKCSEVSVESSTGESTGKKKYQCKSCKYSSDMSTNLKNHEYIHSGVKPFKCEHCSYRSTHKHAVKTHELMVHSKIKNFSCFHCEYKCCTKGDLKRHMVIHSDVYTYSCTQCSYKCKHKHSLHSHILQVHEKTKVFQCSECSYNCVQKCQLTKHRRTHTGEKPYTCHLCGYRASVRDTLQDHLKVHLNEKKYKCEACPYRGNTRGHLYAHKKHCRKL